MKSKLLLGLLVVLSPVAVVASPSFTKELGVQVSLGTPLAITTNSVPYRLYFTTDGFTILSATSSNGESWSTESGVRVTTNTTPAFTASSFTITGASLLPLIGGGYRMVYSIFIATSDWRIVSATSSDGLAWANDPVAIFTSAAGFVGSPQLIKRSNGNWQMFFMRDPNGGDDLTDRQIYTSVSSNEGVSWSNPGVVLADYATSIAATVRSDFRARLYLTRPLSQQTTASVVLSALATDTLGTSFNFESGTRLSTDSASGALNSGVVFHTTDTVRWRMLYGYRDFALGYSNIMAATTLDPDPQSVSPSQVFVNNPANSLTIAGEVFDSTPTVRLTHGGETDITGTSVLRNSDLSITATFDTNNKAIGYWNVVVHNSDGRETTLANALLITFPAGDVTLTDNLLRPRTGARTKIDVAIFNSGEVAVSVYTLDGQLVNALYKAQTDPGTLTLYWDGKTGSGNSAASGVYFIKATGPKLNAKQKVVVIR